MRGRNKYYDRGRNCQQPSAKNAHDIRVRSQRTAEKALYCGENRTLRRRVFFDCFSRGTWICGFADANSQATEAKRGSEFRFPVMGSRHHSEPVGVGPRLASMTGGRWHRMQDSSGGRGQNYHRHQRPKTPTRWSPDAFAWKLRYR